MKGHLQAMVQIFVGFFACETGVVPFGDFAGLKKDEKGNQLWTKKCFVD